MIEEELQDAHKVALAFIKYRNGTIHLFGFKDHAGISVGDAIKQYPWILDCYDARDITKICENWNETRPVLPR